MGTVQFLKIRNSESASLDAVGNYPIGDFTQSIIGAVKNGRRISSFFGVPEGEGLRLYIVLAYDKESVIEIASALVKDSFPSLTVHIPSAHLFEREIYEQFGVLPEGHPWLKPVRFQNKIYDLKRHILVNNPVECGEMNYFSVDGDEIHEVAVGPVHAGIIEPGHFRFQCFGELVLNLEISLGYQHRGIEWRLKGKPNSRTVQYMETVAGDTSIGHTLAYAQAIESLSNINGCSKTQILRAIALELERLANHTGDLGALANDVGYLPTASYCGRLRGDFLNITALLCGSRFGRGFIRPGGIMFDVTSDKIKELASRLKRTYKDVKGAVNLLWNTSSIRARFENAGFLTKQDCIDLGIVGVAARACGVEIDIRRDHPFGQYCFSQIPVSTHQSGNVFSRAYVRWLEIQRSVEFIEELLANIPEGNVKPATNLNLKKNSIAVSLVEGWRGEICHVVLTDTHGGIEHYKIVDSSFHNWSGLELAMKNQQISDFPLCNKSFNLSYCGYDL